MEVLDKCHSLLKSPETLQYLAEDAKDFALCNGLCETLSKERSEETTFIHFCLLPTPLPRHVFEFITAVQSDFNLLMHRVANDAGFLRTCLKRTIETHDFTRSLFETYEKSRKCISPQPVSLAIMRNDFLLHCEAEDSVLRTASPKQVEINTFGPDFGARSPVLQKLQMRVMRSLGIIVSEEQMPENRSLQLIVDGLLAAWKYYAIPSAFILIVSEDREENLYDQLFVEYAIEAAHPKAPVIRRRMSDLRGSTLCNGKLFVKNMEVAVVYYRSGYSASQMTEEDWETRLTIELSSAVKCPSLGYQLAGTKKVQQVLAQEGMVERFFPDDVKAVQRIRSTFVGSYSLDLTPEGDSAAQRAIRSPRKYVLKKEGEADEIHIFGLEVGDHLVSLAGKKQRETCVLMDRIRPPVTSSYLVSPNAAVSLQNVASEIGIFGVVLGSEETILLNEKGGFITRTKALASPHGDIVQEPQFLDSVLLI